MKNNLFLLLALASLLLAGCGRNDPPPPAKAPDQAVEAEASAPDEEPGLNEESSREW